VTGSGIRSWTLTLGDGTTRSGTGQPPADLSHTYPAGTHTAHLRVTDTPGRTASDRRTVVAASGPTVTGSERDVTSTSLSLNAWVNTHGHTGTVVFEWGTTTAYGNRSTVRDLPARTWAQHVQHPLSGLQPGTRYHWRVTALTDAGTTVLTRPVVTLTASGSTSTPSTDPPSSDPVVTFVDVPPSHPFHDSIRWMAERGLTTGTRTASGVRFDPSAPVSREALAAFLHRYAGRGGRPRRGGRPSGTCRRRTGSTGRWSGCITRA
jgi:hypothetical protein